MPDRSGWERRPGFELAGKTALVAGAETPAGAAVARALAEAGASVAVVAGAGEATALDGLLVELGAGGRAAYAGAWDMTSPAAVEAGFDELRQSFGAPSILVTACDLPFAAPIVETDDDAYRRTMAAVVDTVWYACRAFLRVLPEDTANARIICITNVFGERGVDNISVYAAAHGAVHNLVRALAQEIGARNGATINGIATGWMTNTPGRGPDELGQNRLMRFTPMRRFGKPDEVGPLAVLLAGEASGYISGQILHIDGGITTHL
ncbi:MAG: SDR family oxidoreductase [Chloroflexi bacterium]|nr:SDR family oxidoreductase [Chloroflexota bacterium]